MRKIWLLLDSFSLVVKLTRSRSVRNTEATGVKGAVLERRSIPNCGRKKLEDGKDVKFATLRENAKHPLERSGSLRTAHGLRAGAGEERKISGR